MLNIDNDIRAGILSDALPFIQKYNNKVVVIKYGGNAMTNDALKEAVMSDIVLLSTVGVKVVLVHGGGPEINNMLKRIGKESRFVNGLRYTDEETIEVVQMVLCGKLNKDLVDKLYRHNSHMIEARQLDPELGLVGEITAINTTVIQDALDHGYIPVIATVASSADGRVYNINADTAAARIAAEMKAENLLLLTDTVGLLRDKDDESTLISQVGLSEVPYLKNQGIISGGMIPKIDCCVEAVRRGVKQSIIIDGRIPHSILIELFTGSGIGTMIK